jgi:excisionase family DNA binding protein
MALKAVRGTGAAMPQLKLVREIEEPPAKIEVLTPCEVAAMLRISLKSVYRAIKSGRLPAVRFNATDPRNGGGWRLGRVAGRWATEDELSSLFPPA